MSSNTRLTSVTRRSGWHARRLRLVPAVQTKKGLLVVSDLLWFVIFLLCAFLIFWFLYHPLNQAMDNRARTSFPLTQLNGDAQFTALTLAQLPTNGPQQVSDNPAYSSVTSLGTIATRLGKHADPDDTLAYETTLASVLGDKEYWLLARSKRATLMTEWMPVQIAVLVTNAQGVTQMDCYSAPWLRVEPNDAYCSAVGVFSHRASYATPEQFATKWLRDYNGAGTRTSVGVVALPAATGPVHLEVYVHEMSSESVKTQ